MEKVSRYRKAMNLTQKDMALKFGLSRQSYYRKEKGYVPFTDIEKVVIVDMFKKEFPEVSIERVFFSDIYKEMQRCKQEEGELNGETSFRSNK